MNSKERIRCTLELREPDRVPIGELLIDSKVIKAANANYKDVVDFALGEGLDLVGAYANYGILRKLSDDRYIDEWGIMYKTTPDFIQHPLSGPITLETDLDKFNYPDPDASNRLGGLEMFVKKAEGKLNINFLCRADFMWPVCLMGMDNLFMAMALEPDFAHKLFDKTTDINIAVIRRAIRTGADTVTIGDDYCGNDGPLMGPQMFREFILPNLKRTVTAIHEEGAKCIKHSDGNVWPLLDMFIEAGVDAINPLEPVANMDVAEVKEKYGHNVCLMGNIDCGELLCNGSKAEVELAVKDCINKGARSGGLIISSSNTIHCGVNPENYLTMINAVHKYGKYPIY